MRSVKIDMERIKRCKECKYRFVDGTCFEKVGTHCADIETCPLNVKSVGKRRERMNAYDKIKKFCIEHGIEFEETFKEDHRFMSIDTALNSFISVIDHYDENSRVRIHDNTDWEGDFSYKSRRISLNQLMAELE